MTYSSTHPLPSLHLEAAEAWLRERLSHERFLHSQGAYHKAIELAEKFRLPPADQERVGLSALLHDAAKLLSPSELIHYCDSHGLPLEEADRQSPQALHPFVGAEMVRQAFGVEDAEILDGIRYHTTGRPGMSMLEKIVYIADKIEGNTRNPLYIKKMTAGLDFKDPRTLDLTMLFLLDSTLGFLMEKSQHIHPRTLLARNDFITRLQEQALLDAYRRLHNPKP